MFRSPRLVPAPQRPSANGPDVSVADAHLGAVIQSTSAGQQITVVTSDSGDMRLVAGDRDITVVAV
jgi:hypothetical protein